jgi:hypothetical protein
MPDSLKATIESLSGFAMDDVRVHFNSPRPARPIIGDAESGTYSAVCEGHPTKIVNAQGYAAVYAPSAKQFILLAKRAAGKAYKLTSLGGERSPQDTCPVRYRGRVNIDHITTELALRLLRPA